MTPAGQRLTGEGRQVVRAAAVAAAVNLVGLVIIGVLIGIAGATGSLGLLRAAIGLLSGVPALLGALVGSRMAAGALDTGLPAAAVGVSGSLVVVVVLVVVGNLGEQEAAVGSAVVAPLLGALVGGWLGGVQPSLPRRGR